MGEEIVCPNCGNKEGFIEVLVGCTYENRYELRAGKWVLVDGEVNSNCEYELLFECKCCGHDCMDQHEVFLDQYLRCKGCPYENREPPDAPCNECRVSDYSFADKNSDCVLVLSAETDEQARKLLDEKVKDSEFWRMEKIK